ncbi:hypothetical protein [Nocardioides sp. CFH 31398]|uniref:hypothetical protein n=1 Tax=Nocardioides sp. CFH 31398 TaxID=2919579 RepID=UPI001F06907E|nr:hypothetical protein [Nocardioides sp. CFH 31398]MCH1866223.1 hypothetical protein [Nocardioides sp. CFH 31398]
MGIDWERELDRAIAPGGDRPPSDFVAPGRRALRRRRTAVSAASAAAVAVVVGLGSLVGGSAGLVGEPPAGIGVAEDPSQGPSEGGTVDRVEDGPTRGGAADLRMSCRMWDAEPHPARYDGRGTLCLAEGAEVLERVPDPLGYGSAGKSVGLHLAVDGGEQFALATWRPDDRSQVSDRAAGELSDWLPAQVAAQRDRDVDAAAEGWVSLTDDGEMVAGPGVDLVELVEVDLGPGFAPDGVSSWAAELRVDGVRELVLLRNLADGTEVVRQSGDFATFEAFVADAEERYPEIGGSW